MTLVFGLMVVSTRKASASMVRRPSCTIADASEPICASTVSAHADFKVELKSTNMRSSVSAAATQLAKTYAKSSFKMKSATFSSSRPRPINDKRVGLNSTMSLSTTRLHIKKALAK